MRTVLPALALIVALPTAAAAGMRCGNLLAQEGDTKLEVLRKCGEPALQETLGIERTPTGEVLVERWTYDLGPGRFLQLLRFEAGELVAVENGERQ